MHFATTRVKLKLTDFMPVLLLLLFVVAGCSSSDPGSVSKPKPNPYLASPLYAITHFDPSQSDSTPYGPPRNSIVTVDLSTKPVVYGGPINIITAASTNADYMWHVGSDRVSYIHKANGQWTTVTSFQALDHQSGGLYPAIPDANFRTFGIAPAVGMDVTSMDAYLKTLFGANYKERYGNAIYVLVDNNNVLYTNYGTTLYGFTLTNPADPSAGISIRYELSDIINKIQGASPPGARLFGLSMTYDGHLIVTFSNGVAVIDRDLNPASAIFYPFPATEYVSNSIAVDENNGIYIATGPVSSTVGSSIMRKLVWTGTAISDKESDGAWSCPYDNSLPDTPPIIKVGWGTGSTPTLMGFGNDPDKLVVITDGAKQMKLVAFWRDAIPDGFVQKPGTASRRVAGQIQVTCGFSPVPEWVQTEQSVVVYGYGAFVVNNIPQVIDPAIVGVQNKILECSLMGPAYPTSFGAQRFAWNPYSHEWSSVWARSDVSSTSMVPVYSESGNMALINGYTSGDGWQVLGMDWNSGSTVHQMKFGDINFGNGAYAILQYLENGDLLFNSFSGPLRVGYGP